MTARVCIALTFSAATVLAQSADVKTLNEFVLTHQTTDPILTKAAARVGAALAMATSGRNVAPVGLYLTEFGNDERFAPYRARKCVPEAKAFGKPAIVCDAAFFREVELMLRTFEAGGPIFMNEHNVLEVTKLMKRDPDRRLRGFRGDSDRGQGADHIAEHLAAVMLFVAGHELGHIVNGDADAGFMKSTGSPIDRSADRAVLKLCRHADEFARDNFGLAMWRELVTPGSPPRKSIEEIRARYRDEDEVLASRFASERKADEFASDVFVSYLAARSTPVNTESDFIAAQSLFSFALFYWHETFLGLEQICDLPVTSHTLGICFMQARDRYRAAETVFGAEHRVMYLRAAFALEALVGKYLQLLPDPQHPGSVTETLNRARDDKQRSILYMYATLKILMDTPVKLAYAGCQTGTVQAGTTSAPLVMMFFEPIESALKRLEKLLQGQ